MNLQGSKLDILLVSMTLAQPRNFKRKYNISGSTYVEYTESSW